MSQTIKELEFKGRKIILIGTAHISQESIDDVTRTIEAEKPDCVAVELDEQRYASIKNPDSWKNLDISKVLRSGQGFVLLANLVLSSFQKRIGSDIGVKPGSEMVAAIEISEKNNIPTAMVDRPIRATLQRAWAKNSLWGKCKLLSVLISSAFGSEEVSAEDIEKLKNSNEMDSMMNELSDYLPSVKEVLIDERDFYLASSIWNSTGNKIVAVLGAGHVPGVVKHLEQLSLGTSTIDIQSISQIPPKTLGAKVLVWAIPALILGLIATGFLRGGVDTSVNMLIDWLLANGTLAAIGAIIALAHPLAVAVSFVGAPITSLNPFIGIGIVSGLTQAWIRKPKVEDMEQLMNDISSVKGFYKNRILRVLLVFLLSSIGSSIGTFVALPALVKSVIAS